MIKNMLSWIYYVMLATVIVYVGYYTVIGGKNVYEFYKTVQNQEAQMEELYENDSYILEIIFRETNRNEDVFDYEILETNKKIENLVTEINIIREENKAIVGLLEFQNKKIVKQSGELNSQNIKITDLAINLVKAKRDVIVTGALDYIEAEMKETKPSYDYLESVTVYVINRYSENEGSIGTGVVVKQDSRYTYIMTNKHVCNEYDVDTCSIEIYKYGKFVEIPLQFVRQTESKYDLSLWKTSERLPNKRVIKGLAEIKKQDKIYSVGSYLGFQNIYTEGTFGGYDEGGSYILNLPCTHGCSGSGVYDKDGKLVSIVFTNYLINIFQSDSAKSIGIPSEIVRLFLRNLI